MCNHKSRPVVSPIAGDCVVEPVGLEPTTKVLWNMVGVRPTPLVDTHPDTGSFTVLRDYPGVLRRAVHVGPTGPFLKAGFLDASGCAKCASGEGHALSVLTVT